MPSSRDLLRERDLERLLERLRDDDLLLDRDRDRRRDFFFFFGDEALTSRFAPLEMPSKSHACRPGPRPHKTLGSWPLTYCAYANAASSVNKPSCFSRFAS